MAKSPFDPPSSAYVPKELEDKFRTAFGGGGTVSLTFSGADYLSIDSGLFIQMKGGSTHLVIESETSLDPLEVIYDMDWKLLYFSIPVHARFSIGSGKITPYIKTGIDIDFLLSAQVDETITVDGLTESGHSDIEDDLTSFDLGFVAGAGVEYAIGGNAILFIEGTYCHGLTDILDPENAGFDVVVKNRVIGIMGGVRF
jgi:hypothetical protein